MKKTNETCKVEGYGFTNFLVKKIKIKKELDQGIIRTFEKKFHLLLLEHENQGV